MFAGTRSIAVIATILLFSAGCLSHAPAGPVAGPSESDNAQPNRPDPATPTGTGAIAGRVLDEEAIPILGAIVALEGRSAPGITDAFGIFSFEDVPSGLRHLVVGAPGYHESEASVVVAADATVDVEVVLAALPADVAYQSTARLEGHYDCANEIPIWTGDCMLPYETQNQAEDPVTTEQFSYRMPVGPEWESVLLELDWTYAANNQLDGMRLYLENANGTAQGHSYKVGRADGPEPPLRVLVHRGEPHPRADLYVGTTTTAFIPDAGEEVQIRVFPRGYGYEFTQEICTNPFQGQGCLLGLGIGLDLRFTVYATVFYRARAPDSFTALPS